MHATDRDEITRTLEALPSVTHRMDGDRLREYLAELFDWNPRLGLVSKQRTAQTVIRLIEQSVALWDFVAEVPAFSVPRPPTRVGDVGSGAGFPGLVWKLLAPDLAVTLIERKRRRALFLERVVSRLGLDGLDAVEGDALELSRRPELAGAFDLVVMLAVAPPSPMEKALTGLLRTPGYFCTVRSRAEKVVPGTVGPLQVTRSVTTETGIFLLYEKQGNAPRPPS